jgi:quercetin dioxygenase-like cupin family protein
MRARHSAVPAFFSNRWTIPTLFAVGSLSLFCLMRSNILVDAGSAHPGYVLHADSTGAAAQARPQRPATIVRPLSCEKLADIPGKSVTTAIVDFPPGAYSPRHRHPGSVTAYVLKGTLRSQLAGGPVETYTAGQTWFEPPGAIHLFAENASSTEPAQLLAIFITNDNCGPLVIPDDRKGLK